MTTPIPDDVRRLYDGRDLARKVGLASYLLTTSENGWPHSAMVSAGEVLLAEDDSVRLALWEASRTTSNVIRTGEAVLLVVMSGQSYRIGLTLAGVGEPATDMRLRFFAGRVAWLERDSAPYATVVDGVRYELTDVEATLARWRRVGRILQRIDAGGGDRSSPSPDGAS